MRENGWLLIVVGVALAVIGIQHDVTIDVSENYIPGVSERPTPDVINIGKLQQQLMLFQAGLTLFLGGLILLATDGIISHLKKSVLTVANLEARPLDEPSHVEVD